MERKKNRSVLPLAVILSTILIMAATGCGTGPEYWKIYSSMQEPVLPDSGVLRGRSIVIDPGHGGAFRGVEGMKKLSEADANLGVALYLWGMLENAGANVFLTRTIDRDFLDGDSEALRVDLENRMKLANSAEADLFLSIHHNSSLPLKRGRNRIEIYYRRGLIGSSAELARITRLHLERNLGIGEAVVKPGDYFVLRNSNAGAAILGEASYLSHPVVEDSLKLSAKQKLEAQAYFVALQHYFSRGIPSLRLVYPEADTLDYAPRIIYRAESRRGIDPSTARIYINGAEAVPSVDRESGTLYYGIPPHAPNGEYTIRSRIRSSGGGIGSSPPFSFVINRKPAFILPLPAERGQDSCFTVSARILDQRGNPVIDSLPVAISARSEGMSFRSFTREGVCSFSVREERLPGHFVISAPGKTDTLFFDKPAGITGKRIQVVDAMTGDPLPFPLAIAAGRPDRLEGGPRGTITLPEETGEITVFRAGYRPAAAPLINAEKEGRALRIELAPLWEGALRDKRIAVNPASGGDLSGTTGRNKIRESTVNIRIAERVCELMRACGAKVIMTRSGEETVSAEERVERANRFSPDLAISIHHDTERGGEEGRYTIRHYPGSRDGARFAGLLLPMLETLFPEGSVYISESAEFFLTHTTCPASAVHLGSMACTGAEEVISSLAYQYYLSDRILAAVARYFEGEGGGQAKPFRIKVVDGEAPVPGSYVTLDNLLTLPTDEEGAVMYSHVDSGEHLIVIHRNGETVYSGIKNSRDCQDGLLIELRTE
ncbi:MAG: hypothetical protein GF417_03985 [Candidatus Latescibacteria bacterium]|nr:hypothetical protein [bacterium]MBD3423586.1 hypothetical protein [Candidatus Latescibacterota bacterium]